MENEESLKTGAVVGKFADAVKDEINNLLANGVVTTSVDALIGTVQVVIFVVSIIVEVCRSRMRTVKPLYGYSGGRERSLKHATRNCE
jgi:phosphatidylglycerophosphate synthase